MRIPDQKINEILSAANIVDVISNYVQLKKRGKNFVGLCPFHQEKTPSFTVSEEKQIFRCFGCQAGGNVYKFLMEYKGISFVEAVEELANQFGIQLEAEEGYNIQAQSEQEKMYELNVVAAKFFNDYLLNNSDAEIARKYFEQRNIKLKTQRNFGLGFAPFGWDNFVNYATQNKIDLNLAQILGLVDKKSSGGFYDKFRGRIIFPILSPNGRVIAFGGRILEKNNNIAKYLNSPESIIYSKRRTLYGLFHSKDEIRKLDKAILVEGYMDLISLFQNGIKNVVASSGTALSEEQVQLLSRYTKNIIVIFDADNAGQKATLRSIEILLKQDFDVRILSLPEGEDPDSFVQRNGKDEFNEKLKSAENFLEYQTKKFSEAGMFDDAIKSAEAIRQLVKTASFVVDDLKRSMLLKSIAKKFKLKINLIEDEAQRFFKLNKNKKTNQNNFSKSAKPDTVIIPSTAQREKEIITLLFEGDPQVLDFIFDNILPQDFLNDKFKKIASIVYDAYIENDIYKPSTLIEKIEDEELKSIVLKLIVDSVSISDKWEDTDKDKKEKIIHKYAFDVIKAYQLNQIDAQLKKNSNILASIENEEEMLELLKLNNDLENEKKTILNQTPFYLQD